MKFLCYGRHFSLRVQEGRALVRFPDLREALSLAAWLVPPGADHLARPGQLRRSSLPYLPRIQPDATSPRTLGALISPTAFSQSWEKAACPASAFWM